MIEPGQPGHEKCVERIGEDKGPQSGYHNALVHVLDDQNALDAICEMLGGFYGRAYSADDFIALGKDVLVAERRFNAAAGFTAADDRLPDFFKKEKLAPHDVTFTVTDEELDEVHSGAD